MKILFIYPDNTTAVGYSSGIGILSALLNENGHQTKLMHISKELGYPLHIPTIVNDILRLNPGAICFSVTTPQWKEACRIGRAIKEAAPNIPTVAGGPHVTADPMGVMEENWVDFACRGEGDIALPELLQRLEQGLSADGLNNVLHRRNGMVVKEPLGLFVQELDSLPFEDRDIFDYGRIIETRTGWAEVIVTRGCPYPCSYCFNTHLLSEYRNDQRVTGTDIAMKSYIRRRSPDKTIEMLLDLRRKYPGISGFTFVDDILAIEEEWLREFTELYMWRIGLPYACTSHPLLFNEKIGELLRRSGCKVVKMGIESGNLEIRKQVLMRNIPDDYLIRQFELAHRLGLKTQAFNMIGLPGETINQMMDTVRLNARIKPYIVWLSTFIPYPGTRLYQECLAKGMIDKQRWDSMYSYRGDSVLCEEFLPSLPFKKIRVLFRWLVNESMAEEAAAFYRDHIAELMGLPDDDWHNGRAEEIFAERDPVLDRSLREKNISHYVNKKYLNILWGAEFEYDLT